MIRFKRTPVRAQGTFVPCSDLPLFKWGITAPQSLKIQPSHAAQKIARRFHLPLSTARVVSELAGFSMEDLNV
jgi:hypothetical protein